MAFLDAVKISVEFSYGEDSEPKLTPSVLASANAYLNELISECGRVVASHTGEEHVRLGTAQHMLSMVPEEDEDTAARMGREIARYNNFLNELSVAHIVTLHVLEQARKQIVEEINRLNKVEREKMHYRSDPDEQS